MGRMSEIAIEISERVREGQAPDRIAADLNIPLHWVTEIAEENEYNEMEARYRDEYAAEQYADADAEMYGTF